jgi:UDP-N-acetyl-D-glucosamine dehydrogenase
VSEALNERQKCINGSKILIMGLSYKENIDDTRESPAHDIIKFLQQRGADLSYYDTHVQHPEEMGDIKRFEYLPGNLQKIDCAIIVTGHREVDYEMLVEHCPVVFDSRNVLKGFSSSNIVRL